MIFYRDGSQPTTEAHNPVVVINTTTHTVYMPSSDLTRPHSAQVNIYQQRARERGGGATTDVGEGRLYICFFYIKTDNNPSGPIFRSACVYLTSEE